MKLKRLIKWILYSALIAVLFSIVLVLILRWVDPPSSAFILKERLTANGTQYQYWVPLGKISPQLWIAVVAAEDQKFPSHFGFDVDSIASALNEKRKRIRGASTITQQLAKNLFLWNGRSYLRKALEAYFTLLIEIFWPKQRILEVYLNIVEFGRGVYGAEAASRRFFKKSAQHLNRDEAALLAAVLPNPKRMYAYKPSAYVIARADEIKYLIKTLGGVAYLKF